MRVSISLKSAEILARWLKDLNIALHMVPNGTEYNAFLELSGAISDSHYQEKLGTMEEDDEDWKANPAEHCCGLTNNGD